LHAVGADIENELSTLSVEIQVAGIMALVILGVSVQALDRITDLLRMERSTAVHLTMLFDLPEICWFVSIFFSHRKVLDETPSL